jgi:hypothetical protein
VNFNTVLSYLNNQVSVEERDGFFVFLKQNKEAVDDDAVFGALLFLEKNNWNIELLKNKIVDLNTSFRNPYKENTFKRISILKYAAAIVLVFGVSYFIFEKNKSNNDIYEPYDTGIPNFFASATARCSFLVSTTQMALGSLVMLRIPSRFLFSFSRSRRRTSNSFLVNN